MKFKKVIGSWNVEKQKEITGKILRVQEQGGKFDTKVYTLETDDAIVDVFGSTVLDDKIKSLCEIGNVVQITFLGKVQGKDAEYKDFDVALGVAELKDKLKMRQGE